MPRNKRSIGICRAKDRCIEHLQDRKGRTGSRGTPDMNREERARNSPPILIFVQAAVNAIPSILNSSALVKERCILSPFARKHRAVGALP